MNFKEKLGGVPAKAGTPFEEPSPEDFEFMDPELTKALGEFRLSVHAWSEAAYCRPRRLAVGTRRQVWRRAAGWALCSVLVIGGASTGVLKHHERELQMRIVAAQAVEHERLAAQQREQQARQEKEEVLAKEDLLANVNKDVSRQVPAAMEPLGRLMAGDESW